MLKNDHIQMRAAKKCWHITPFVRGVVSSLPTTIVIIVTNQNQKTKI